MNTYFLLMAEFGEAFVPVSIVAKKYLSLSKDQATRKAKRHELPFPAFQGGSQKSEWVVAIEHLAKWLDWKMKDAQKEWEAMNDVRRKDD
ncbi:MAG: pyocin activator PrtN family protein [Candidatus Sedimenticola sp. (ex Thyasira tokunagai)]